MVVLGPSAQADIRRRTIHEFYWAGLHLCRQIRGSSCQAHCCPAGKLHGRFFFAPFAIQFCSQRTQKDLGYRISTLCVGRVETEKNQSTPKRGIKLPTFFVPDSSVPGTRMTE
jgi:hypothetical protein